MTNGKINLITGPMYSGKTTRLLERYRRYKIAGKNCLLIKFNRDKRYSNEQIVTHDKITYDAFSVGRLEDVNEIICNYDVICIDEIQFFNDGPVFCEKWANDGKIIEVCGLNGDYNKEPFESVSRMIPLVDDITYLKAVDKHSGKDAPFTVRLIDAREQILIGGKNIYDVMDRDNYNRFMKSRQEMY